MSNFECTTRQELPQPLQLTSTFQSPSLIPGNEIPRLISNESLICDDSVELDSARPHSLWLKSPQSTKLLAVNSPNWSSSTHLHKSHTVTTPHMQHDEITATTKSALLTSRRRENQSSAVGHVNKRDHHIASSPFQIQSSGVLHRQLPSLKSATRQQHRLSVELHESPKIVPNLERQHSKSSPSLTTPETEMFSLDEPKEDMWLHDESFIFYSGWCLQSTGAHQCFTLNFMHTVILRLMHVFAPESPKKSMSPFHRECSIWKKGLRWLNLDGIETFVMMVEDGRAIMVLMRTKKGSELKGICLRSALISRVLSTKDAFLCRMPTVEFLIDPKHLQENDKYPIITQKLDQLTKYDVSLIAHAIVAPKQKKPCK